PRLRHQGRSGTVGRRAAQHVEADGAGEFVVPRRQPDAVAPLLAVPRAAAQGALRRVRDTGVPMIPEDLIEAYESADYVVFAEPELVLKIGEPSARLDALLETEQASTAAFVTTANPRSEKKSAAENAAALGVLDQLVAASGYPWRAGEGREPDGSWREPSRLVMGIYRENAEALGRLFGQNAIMFVEKGAEI